MRLLGFKTLARIGICLFIISLALIFSPLKAAPADVYWVGGPGNWTDAANHWSDSDGGAPGAGNLPDSTSNVHFTASSNTTSYTVTVNNVANCKDMIVGNPSSGAVTIAGSSALNIYGSLSRAAGVLWTRGGTTTFAATSGTHNVTSNGGSFTDAFSFSGSGGTWQFIDAFNGTNISVASGATLDTNGQTVTLSSSFASSSGSTLTLGASSITTVYWNCAATTLTAGTSTINVNSANVNLFVGGSKTYNNAVLTISGNGDGLFSGANTFANLTLAGTDVADANILLSGNQIITGTLTMTGYSASHRLLIFSNTLHTQRSLTAATVSVSNLLFRDIIGSGAGSWNFSARTDIGDCGGNSGISFPVGISVYGVGWSGSFNWSNASKWASTTGGVAGSGRVPLPQDIAIFDANSVSVPGVIITFDISNISGINTTAVTNNPQFNSTTLYVYNSINLGTCNWNVASDTYMYGQMAQAISGSFTDSNVRIDVQGGSVSQNGSLTIASGNTLYILSGIFQTNNYALTAGSIDAFTSTYTRGFYAGSSTISLINLGTASGTLHFSTTNLAYDFGTSTIYISKNSAANAFTLASAGITFYDMYIEGSGAYTTSITSAFTCHNLTVVRSEAAKTLSGAYTITITNGLFLPVTGTTTITITNTDFSKASGVVISDYLVLSGSAASGGALFYAGSHATNGGGNSGWSFTDYPGSYPTATTAAASGVTTDGATLNGVLSNLGSFDNVYGFFQYDIDGTYVTPYSTTPQLLSADGPFNATVSGLTYNLTYHFRAVVRYLGVDYSYGADTTFLTLGAPTIATLDATNIAPTTATLQGNLTSLGNYTPVYVHFEYGDNISYGYTTLEQTLTTVTVFNAGIVGLTPTHTYHFRAVVRYNISAYVYGSDMSFVAGSTPSSPGYTPASPLVTTNPATNIGVTSARLNGTLNSLGGDLFASCYFEYGHTTAYGTQTSPVPYTTTGTFYADIGYLYPNYEYHFRAIAQFGSNTYVGSDLSFTTSSALGSNTDLRILNGAVFSNYVVTGDLLFTAESMNYYTTLYPNKTPGESFTIQLIATDNTTILGAFPLANWGTKPVSIYVGPAQATGLTLQSAYYIRMQATASSTNVSYQLQATDWKGSNLVYLDNWCVSVAKDMGQMDVNGNTNYYLTPVTEANVQINDLGGQYFTSGIPAIGQIRPYLFTTSQAKAVLLTGGSSNAWDSPTAWQTYLGINLSNDLTTMASPLGINGKDFATMLIFIAIVGFVLMLVGGSGAGALGAALLAVPLLWLGTWFRIVNFAILGVIVLFCLALAIRQFIIKTL